MKKFLLLGVLSVFSLNSFAQSSFTCPEIYQRILVAKEIKKEKTYKIAEWTSSLGGLALINGAYMVGAPLLLATAGVAIYSSTSSREERALNLMEEGNRHLSRLTKRLQKKVSSDITSDEVISVIEEGLISGEFCKDFPKLANRQEIKDHVTDVLKLKYAVTQ